MIHQQDISPGEDGANRLLQLGKVSLYISKRDRARRIDASACITNMIYDPTENAGRDPARTAALPDDLSSNLDLRVRQRRTSFHRKQLRDARYSA